MGVMGVAMAATLARLWRRGRAVTPGRLAGRHALANLLATLTLVLWVGVTLAGRGRSITLLMIR